MRKAAAVLISLHFALYGCSLNRVGPNYNISIWVSLWLLYCGSTVCRGALSVMAVDLVLRQSLLCSLYLSWCRFDLFEGGHYCPNVDDLQSRARTVNDPHI